jgi:hypothetical protein
MRGAAGTRTSAHDHDDDDYYYRGQQPPAADLRSELQRVADSWEAKKARDAAASQRRITQLTTDLRGKDTLLKASQTAKEEAENKLTEAQEKVKAKVGGASDSGARRWRSRERVEGGATQGRVG